MEDAIHLEAKQVKGNKKAKGSLVKATVISKPPQVHEETDTEDEGLELTQSDGEGRTEAEVQFMKSRGHEQSNILCWACFPIS